MDLWLKKKSANTERRNEMSTDYERGYKQFAEMVGEENKISNISK